MLLESYNNESLVEDQKNTHDHPSGMHPRTRPDHNQGLGEKNTSFINHKSNKEKGVPWPLIR